MPPNKQQQKNTNNSISKLFGDIDEMIANSVKRDELAMMVKKILESVKAIETRILNNVAQNKDGLESEITKVQRELTNAEMRMNAMTGDMHSKSMTSLQNAVKQLNEEVNKVQEQIPNMPDIPDYTEYFGGIESKIKVLFDSTTGENVRNTLEALPEGDKLAIDAIEGLRKELNELKKAKSANMNGGGIVGRDIVKNYDLSSHLNGVTKTFNIPGVWSIISVACSSFPNVLRPVIDYTNTDSTITFTSEIDAGTTLATGQTVVLTIVSG